MNVISRLLCILLMLVLVCANEESKDTIECTTKCNNGGYCNPDSGQCVCPSNCRGMTCDECTSTISFSLIFFCIMILIFVGYTFSWIADLIKRKCRFYKQVAVQDPFVDNLESVGIAASNQNSTAGEKLGLSPETPVSRWYRNNM